MIAHFPSSVIKFFILKSIWYAAHLILESIEMRGEKWNTCVKKRELARNMKVCLLIYKPIQIIGRQTFEGMKV